jgi:hypothetical protein
MAKKKKIERTNNGSQSTTFKAKDFADCEKLKTYNSSATRNLQVNEKRIYLFKNLSTLSCHKLAMWYSFFFSSVVKRNAE